MWDWNEKTSKWENGGIYQHIAMYGACEGTIMNDFNYHSLPSYISEIRDIIYTDTASNFDSLIILQEPFTRWFKPVDGEPYFDNGDGAKRLVLKEEQDALFQTDYVPAFTDQLAKATDGNGAIFNEIGYKRGYMWEIDGVTLTSTSYLLCTGFIPVQIGSVVRIKGMSFSTGSDYARVILFDSNFNKLVHTNRGLMVDGTAYHVTYEETDDGCTLKINAPADVAYIKINVYLTSVSNNPVIAVDEEINYVQQGFLTDGIHVKEPNITGMDKYERVGRMVTQISAASTNEQYPTAKAVYDLVQQAIAAAIGQ